MTTEGQVVTFRKVKKLLILLVAIGVIGGGYFLLNSNKSSQTDSIQMPQVDSPQPSPTSEATTLSTSSTQEIKVTGKNFSFTPATINVKKGDTVKITFKSEGGTHDLVIPDFNVQTKILQSGKEETIQFTADKTGTFEYFCSVGNHRQMGMKGQIIVQ